VDWPDDDDWREPANTLPLLQKWFSYQCDGTWEHHHGVVIQSCDNPGWWVKIDLHGTPLEGKPFTRFTNGLDADGQPETDKWMTCYVEKGVWNGAGDRRRLNHILLAFLDWLADIDPYWPTRPPQGNSVG
jgi:hypothetical protein